MLFPGGVLPLRVFEQRYIEMTKTCLKDARPFGVVPDHAGRRGRARRAARPEFAPVGTLATIAAWDMPELGILHVTAIGGERFQVQSHDVEARRPRRRAGGEDSGRARRRAAERRSLRS